MAQKVITYTLNLCLHTNTGACISLYNNNNINNDNHHPQHLQH